MEMKNTELDERELGEILEMAQDAAEKARSMGEIITENSKKWRERAENKESNQFDIAIEFNEVRSQKSEVRSLFLLRGFMPRHKNFSLLFGEVLNPNFR
jgi:hypothetical protein